MKEIAKKIVIEILDNLEGQVDTLGNSLVTQCPTSNKRLINELVEIVVERLKKESIKQILPTNYVSFQKGF